MKWITHQTAGVLAASFLGLPMEALAAAFVGAVAPDMIDQKISRLGPTQRARQKIFNSIHRGASHWFGWWLALLLASLAFSTLPGTLVASGFFLGALSHVALDAMTTTGVPVGPFGRKHKVSLRFCATGSFREYCFLAVLLAIGVVFYLPQLKSLLALI